MKKVFDFCKKEIVFTVALVLTIISMFFVPVNAGYIEYIDFKVIALLFCLMAVVEGFKKIGVFDVISYKILSRTKNSRTIGMLLAFMCFFVAMLVTNDVALITFVPLTFILLGDNDNADEVIFIVVMETIAANLGSMVTPIGNPQNLYLYSYFNMGIGEFLKVVLPFGVASFVLIFVVMWLKLKKATLDIEVSKAVIKSNFELVKYLVMFVLCLLVVLNVLDYRICFGIILVGMLLGDVALLKKVDYILLLTFVCFFVFVGNIGAIDTVRELVSSIIQGKTMIVGVALSQIISNVPAAVMLSGFTDDAKELMVGVNLGGLGTLIASLASLISYKFYAQKYPGSVGRYIKNFTIYNVLFLGILLVLAIVI